MPNNRTLCLTAEYGFWLIKGETGLFGTATFIAGRFRHQLHKKYLKLEVF